MMKTDLPCCFLSLISRFLLLTLVGKPTACRGRDEVHSVTHTCNYSYTLNEAAPIVNLVADCILYDANTTALLCPKSHLDSPTFHHHRRADGMPWPGLPHRIHMQLPVHPEWGYYNDQINGCPNLECLGHIFLAVFKVSSLYA